MREFGMGYFETLALPLKTFWSLNRQVSRLRAEEDIRSMGNTSAVNSAEGFEARMRNLQSEIGTPSLVVKRLDEDAFMRLKKQFGQG